MDKKMEITIEGLGLRDIDPVMGCEMEEEEIESEMYTWLLGV